MPDGNKKQRQWLSRGRVWVGAIGLGIWMAVALGVVGNVGSVPAGAALTLEHASADNAWCGKFLPTSKKPLTSTQWETCRHGEASLAIRCPHGQAVHSIISGDDTYLLRVGEPVVRLKTRSAETALVKEICGGKAPGRTTTTGPSGG